MASRCAVNVKIESRRAELVERGEDPDDPAVIAGEVARDMAEMMDMLQQDAEERGIDLDDVAVAPPVATAAQRLLEDRGHGFAIRAMELLRDGGEADAVAAMVVGAKVTRIAGGVSDSWELDDESTDSSANLIMIEQLLAEVAAAVDRLGARAEPDRLADYERARDELLEALRPLFAAVDPAVRSAIADLTAAGRAPSPHCVI